MPAIQPARTSETPPIRLTAPLADDFEQILSAEAIQFVAELERRFGNRRRQLLGLREDRQQRLNNGELPGFRPETAELRDALWQVKQAPADLQDRRVEFVGPADRETAIHALYSGASCYVADFEDTHGCRWTETMAGQLNLRDIVQGRVSRPAGQEDTPRATLIVRPRGWHRQEPALLVDGNPVSASLFDFGLFMFHNGIELTDQLSAPCFYLPKLEGYIEAQLWADVFAYAEECLGLNHGTVCCSVTIETVPAAFEMEEILFTLRDYIVGLNLDRQDYLFSFIKRFRANPRWTLSDPAGITADAKFLRSLSRQLIQVCHRRGAHALGDLGERTVAGADSGINAHVGARFRAEKEQEVNDGHDGTWVADLQQVPVAGEIFDRLMPGANQVDRPQTPLEVTESALLDPPQGEITATELRHNVRIALRFLAGWLDGRGVVATDSRLYDTASAEIARSRIWQWIHHPNGRLIDGHPVTIERVDKEIANELLLIHQKIGQIAYDTGHYQAAADLFRKLIADDRFAEFLTEVAC